MVGDQRDGHRDNRDHRTDDDELSAVFFKDSADAAADLHADGDKEQHQEEHKEQIADNAGLEHRSRAGVAQLALLHALGPGLCNIAQHNAGEDAARNAQREVADFHFAQQQAQCDSEKNQKELVRQNRNQSSHNIPLIRGTAAARCRAEWLPYHPRSSPGCQCT